MVKGNRINKDIEGKKMTNSVCHVGGNLLRLVMVMLVSGLVFISGCVQEESPPTTEAPQLIYPDKDAYIEQIGITLKLVRGTLEIAEQASRDLADGRITREEFREVAVSGRRNLEGARVDMNSVVPPPEVILGKITFEDMHDELMRGIESYIKAFDEMIEYGNDGRISHIDKATDYIENYGDPYINSVTTQLRIVQKE